MTLAEMRTMLRGHILDRGDGWADAALNALLNAAARHVANIADGADQALFVTSATTTLATGGDDFVPVALYGADFALPAHARLRRLLNVWRTGGDRPIGLNLVAMEDRESHIEADNTQPACYLAGQTLVLITPADNIPLRIDYVLALPDMTQDSDTPGQRGGAGTANLLPEEYHAMIPAYAAVLALRGDNIDAGGWMATFAELQGELLATLTTRRGARTGKP